MSTDNTDGKIITMVIPTYRRPQLLRRAISSVLNQTHPHVRVCVYDNASGGKTETVVRDIMRRDSRVIYHRHSENIGTYRNFNYGIMDVKTPFFTLMSDDDMLAPTFYEDALKAFEKYPDAMLVCMPTMVVDSELNVIGAPIEVKGMTYYRAGDALRESVKGSIPCSMWSGILFRTEVRDQIGHPDPDAGPFADAGYLWHAVARFPLVVLSGVAALYMVHPHNMGTEVRMTPLDGTWPGWWEKMIKTVETDEQVTPEVRSQIREFVYPDFRKLAYHQVFFFLGAGRPDLARLTVSGIRACGLIITPLLFAAIVWAYGHIPLARKAFMRAIEIRHAKTKVRRRQLHLKYGHYVAFAQKLQDAADAFNV